MKTDNSEKFTCTYSKYNILKRQTENYYYGTIFLAASLLFNAFSLVYGLIKI